MIPLIRDNTLLAHVVVTAPVCMCSLQQQGVQGRRAFMGLRLHLSAQTCE